MYVRRDVMNKTMMVNRVRINHVSFKTIIVLINTSKYLSKNPFRISLTVFLIVEVLLPFSGSRTDGESFGSQNIRDSGQSDATGSESRKIFSYTTQVHLVV